MDKAEFEESVEAFLGSLVHETLEKPYRDKRHEKGLSLDELLQSFNAAWDRYRLTMSRKKEKASD